MGLDSFLSFRSCLSWRVLFFPVSSDLAPKKADGLCCPDRTGKVQSSGVLPLVLHPCFTWFAWALGKIEFRAGPCSNWNHTSNTSVEDRKTRHRVPISSLGRPRSDRVIVVPCCALSPILSALKRFILCLEALFKCAICFAKLHEDRGCMV